MDAPKYNLVGHGYLILEADFKEEIYCLNYPCGQVRYEGKMRSDGSIWKPWYKDLLGTDENSASKNGIFLINF